MAKLLPRTIFLYLAILIAVVIAIQSKAEADADANIITWTKPGIRYRPRSVTIQPVTVTIVETQITSPTATIQLRSLLPPVKRSMKRAFLNSWSYQGCVADNENLPPMVSPFPYQLGSDEVSGASCMHFCDERGNSLAAVQNGNECWCGQVREASDVTFVEKERCDVPCAAQHGETCGGRESLSVYTKAG
jgi:hypothetical protein